MKPTSNVDSLTESLIQEALRTLLQGQQRGGDRPPPDTIRNADLICVVQDGKIAEQGRHDELLAFGSIMPTCTGGNLLRWLLDAKSSADAS